ncbi:Translation machinery-associated protein 20 [Seiridium cupressi]
MPLVVPGITGTSGNQAEEWTNKLVGKKLSEESSNETSFCKKDLPQQCRVIQPGQMVTKDFVPDRLNVHVKEDVPSPRDQIAQTLKMFKKELQTAPKSKLKSSVQRSLRQSLLTTYPLLNPYIDEILPKKGSLESMKLPDRATLYVLEGEPLFFQVDNSTLLPHLRLVHRFPAGFPSIRIDRGAIRFVLSGATLMAPGLTSAGGRLPSGKGGDPEGLDEDDRWSRELEKGEPVVVRAEGKTEACAVGFLVEGTKLVKEKGKGPVIEDAHYLGDGLWKLGTD